MKSMNKCALALGFALALTAAVAGQSPQGLCCRTVQGLTAEPVAFDFQGRSVIEITIALACHAACSEDESLLVRIRDASISPPYNPTPPEASWTYRGQSSQPVTVKFRLPVPLYFRGPICIDALMTAPDRYAAILGPLMLPVRGSGIQPYGRVDTDRNSIYLSCSTTARTVVPAPLQLQVDGAPPGAPVVFVVSPYQTELAFSMGGRLLVGPAPILPIAITTADGTGRASAQFVVPANVWAARIPIYLQAACDSFDDGPEPWFFSNGVTAVRVAE